MTNSKVQYKIVAGPSREELFDALRLRCEGRKVSFTVCSTTESNPKSVKSTMIFQAKVNKLAVEDGSGNNWLFELYVQGGMIGGTLDLVEGYINTTRREGWMKPLIK